VQGARPYSGDGVHVGAAAQRDEGAAAEQPPGTRPRAQLLGAEVAFGVHPLVVWGKCPIEPDEPVRVRKHDAEPYRPAARLLP
jgi:hypothetical protein